jgi:ABC-type sugar transport system substrate-binding protein
MYRDKKWHFSLRKVALAVAALSTASMSLAVAGGAEAATAKPSIIWLEQGSGNPYWTAQHAAGQVACQRLGCTFKAVSGNGNPGDQSSIMRQLVNEHPTLIMLNAIDPASMVPSIKYAESKGVKVLNMYGVAPQATASVQFDENRTGMIAAQVTIALLKQRYGAAKGQVAILAGTLGQPASDERAAGFVNYMKAYPGVDIVANVATDWVAANATSAMQDLLTKYPKLGFIYTLSDTLGLPAEDVMQRQSRLCTQSSYWTSNPSCVGIVSADGFYAAQVKTGGFFATQLYSPQWSGYDWTALAYDMAVGKKVPSVTSVDAYLIEPQNAACALQMINAMTTDYKTFPWGGTLQEIASKDYHCVSPNPATYPKV